MPDEQKAPAAPSQASRTAAVAEMVNAANALRDIQAQAALEAMRLPDKRLDDASDEGGAPGYTLKAVGQDEYVRVDSEGKELGKASKADVEGPPQ